MVTPRMRTFAAVIGTIAAFLWAGPGLGAQDDTLLALELRPGDGGVEARLGDLLREAGLARSLEAGLPLRYQLVTELWRSGFFDSQVARHEWRATVRYDPIGETYAVETGAGLVLLADSPAEVSAILASEVRVPLTPSTAGRYYYLARLEVETLSLSDLEELRRWLRGELAPAIGPDSNVGGALGRGLRRLFVRILGLPAQRVQARTPAFAWDD